jgi:hypothetical protein
VLDAIQAVDISASDATRLRWLTYEPNQSVQALLTRVALEHPAVMCELLVKHAL